MLCITWNFGENSEEVPDNIHELIRRDIQHDLYVFSAQNCSNMTQLEKNILDLIGNSYTVLAQESYRSLVLFFICRKKIKDLFNIEDIKIDHYRDTNKTSKAVAIGLKIAEKNYAFVNCYINPKSNSNYKVSDGEDVCLPKIVEIDQTLELRPSGYEEQKLAVDSQQSNEKLSDLYDAWIFLGGFNTPIIGSATGVNSLIASNMFEPLKKNDKMYLEFRNYAKTSLICNSSEFKKISYDECLKFEQNSILNPYHEGEIMFAPTYCIIPFTDLYDTSYKSKDDVSYWGWTDRILWTINQGKEMKKKQDFLKQISYDSNNLIKSSQNRPVFSQFLINF